MSASDSSPLRIAQVLRPAAGGMRRHVVVLLTHLDRSRYRQTLFAPPETELQVSAVPAIPLAIAPRTSLIPDLRSIRALSIPLRGQFDLVHAHGLRGALIGVLAARRAGIPSMFTAHNLLPPMPLLSRLILVRLSHSARKVIAVSQAVANSLYPLGVPPEKIIVIPNGIDLSPFDTLPAEDFRSRYGLVRTAPLLVGIGRLSREKGFDIVLDAFARLHALLPDAHLVLAGSGPCEAELHAQAKRQGEEINARILFSGYAADILPLLQAADVVVIPSRQEGQGLVALEAMAARKPVVASRVGGLMETIRDGETGLLVPPESPEALARAIASLLNDPVRSRSLGEAGRARVETDYLLSRTLARLETLYWQSANRR